VYGKATDDSLDIDQQICDADWLDRAMPHWFKTGGNIREQHSNIAAGVAKEYEVKSDGHYITALVVDPVSARKVETGVLKGFSIGIKNPRVIRDNKAANGRITDGQIVEVSLVDRPANPNCQLVLAKSASGDDTIIQVEDLIEKKDKPDYEGMLEGGERSEPADKDLYNRVKAEAKEKFDVYPSAVANSWVVREYKKRGGKYKRKTEKSLHLDQTEMEYDMTTAQELLEVSKSYLAPDVLKFDKKTYDTARQALAQLIQIEAKEMEEGHDEQMSLAHLLEAVHHLFAWYEGEEAEGEVMEETEIELAAKPEKEANPSCDCDGCAACKSAGGSEKSPCAKCMMAKSAEAHKCLECGCGLPEDSHGRADVTTADMVSPDETPKSAEADEPAAEEATEETTENSPEPVSEESVEALVEQVVKSATESMKSEIASLLAATKAAEAKAVALESELATAKSAAVAGGPKRTGIAVGQSNDILSKAAAYKAKANATTDPVLAKGYKQLAEEYLAKASDSTLNK
jgi:hypothetical protein